MTLKELCSFLSISEATGQNWLRLGKIKPDLSSSPISFSNEYVYKLKNDIELGKVNALNKRRNKKYVSGSFFYDSYVPEGSDCLTKVRAISDYLEDENIILSKEQVRLVVAFYARQLLGSSLDGNLRSLLIDELDYPEGADLIEKVPYLFAQKFIYEPGADTLGLLYMSIRDLGSRKNAGSYYTPTNIVQRSVDNLFLQHKNSNTKDPLTVLDPCCGSGNFLIQLPEIFTPSYIYGCDIDPICVYITRINLALKYGLSYTPVIRNNIKCANFLTSSISDLFENSITSPDYIIGNPPWGYSFSNDEKKMYKNLFLTAKGRSVESFDLFTEKAISSLKRGGHLSFVLPEASLTVNLHKALRKIIVSNCNITYLAYLGNVFHKVMCPSIILQLEKSQQELDSLGMRVDNLTASGSDGKNTASFVIATHRKITEDTLSFYTDDAEYSILDTMSYSGQNVYLKGNATFALGIVTGNNDKYIIDMKKNADRDTPARGDGYEVILKGSDINKYHISRPKRFILFEPDNFQQVAPEYTYRAKEKLFYRFISSELTFTLDTDSLLSLNSCNMIIPDIKDMNIRYILAVLNSSPAQFFFQKTFNSVKVLRSHIESIPIPVVSKADQDKIICLVDKLMEDVNLLYKNDRDTTKADIKSHPIYQEIDLMIAASYGLTSSQYDYIRGKMTTGS